MMHALKLVYFLIFAAIVYATTAASLDRNIVTAVEALWPDKWFQATLVDTYCAFLTISLWVMYKEKGWFARIGWFFAIMVLGNIAISVYMLIQLHKVRPGDPVSKLLVREGA